MALVGALIVLVTIVLILLFTRRIQSGRPVHVRAIPSLASLPSLAGKAVESGQTVHVSMGTAGVNDNRTIATLAGLAVLDELADKGCVYGSPPLVTVADPLLAAAAQDSLRQAFARHSRADEHDPTRVEMVSPQPAIYALGASSRLEADATAANVMIGSFDTEALLLAGPVAQKGIPQVFGSDNPQAMALLVAVVDNPIIGEEIFAAPAYLQGRPAHLASLAAEDWVRLGIVALVLLSVLVHTLLGVSLF